MPDRLQLRLPEDSLRRWREAARSDGVSLSEFIRRAVEDRLRGRTTRAIARAVAQELLPEIEGLLSRLPSSTSEPALASVAFDRGCIDADLHQIGRVCASCGGSF